MVVIELGTYVAVPKTARMLADWGATVIKVEPPQGEPWRYLGRRYGVTCREDHNPIFQNENANKKGIVLDLKSEGGKEAFFRLLEKADILFVKRGPWRAVRRRPAGVLSCVGDGKR